MAFLRSDFVADQLANGAPLRALTVVDVFSREALAIEGRAERISKTFDYSLFRQCSNYIMREFFTVSNHGHLAEVNCTRYDFERLKILIEDTSQRTGGIWDFVIRCIDLGIDWPKWWRIYEQQRFMYIAALGKAENLNNLSLNDKDFRDEKWRRYDLCVKLRIATSEEAHYPDLFEAVEAVKPERFDEVRQNFPERVFGRYIMACPPRYRFLDPDKPGPLNEVWEEQEKFFKDFYLLVHGNDVPIDVAVKQAPNIYLREILKRHGVKPVALRKINEHLVLDAIAEDEAEAATIRAKVIAPNLWCRMPPGSFDWDQLQAFRWQSRALSGALADVFW